MILVIVLYFLVRFHVTSYVLSFVSSLYLQEVTDASSKPSTKKTLASVVQADFLKRDGKSAPCPNPEGRHRETMQRAVGQVTHDRSYFDDGEDPPSSRASLYLANAIVTNPIVICVTPKSQDSSMGSSGSCRESGEPVHNTESSYGRLAGWRSLESLWASLTCQDAT